MVVVVLPGALRELAGNRDEVRLAGSPPSVAAALALLWTECPALRDRVITELGEVRPHINIFVDGEDIGAPAGSTPVPDGAELYLLPAISAGPLIRM